MDQNMRTISTSLIKRVFYQNKAHSRLILSSWYYRRKMRKLAQFSISTKIFFCVYCCPLVSWYNNTFFCHVIMIMCTSLDTCCYVLFRKCYFRVCSQQSLIRLAKPCLVLYIYTIRLLRCCLSFSFLFPVLFNFPSFSQSAYFCVQLLLE